MSNISTSGLHSHRFEILMDAGCGAQKAGDILIRALAWHGCRVYSEPVIPAEISPPVRTPPALSGAVIRIASAPIQSIGNATEVILAQHEMNLETRMLDGEYAADVIVLLDAHDSKRHGDAYDRVIRQVDAAGGSVQLFTVVPEAEALIRSLKGAGRNLYYVGILSGVYGIDEDHVVQAIRRVFSRLSAEKLALNLELFHYGRSHAPALGCVLPVCAERLESPILLDGNQAISAGAIDAGFRFLSGYPITPASSILHALAHDLPRCGGMVHQAEDEIAAVGAMLGAYFGGTPSFTVTSGPGFSLKQEFLGYAQMAELPGVVVDVQRAGPSTGMPTKTEQSDLEIAVHGRHGQNAAIVLSVANVSDCFYAPHVARYLAETLRTPITILSDFHVANSFGVVNEMRSCQLDDVADIATDVLERFDLQPLAVAPLIHPNQAAPGHSPDMRRITGLNTDSEGSISYRAETAQQAHATRVAKLDAVRDALAVPTIHGDTAAGVLLCGWGSSRGALYEAVDELAAAGVRIAGMHFHTVFPLPQALTSVLHGYDQVFTVEQAYGDARHPGPFAALLRQETACDVRTLVGQATGRPLTPGTIVDAVKEGAHG
ncbi:MAG TPA: hypothetical protein DCR55_04940 [Lentisphaeria bacterium]|nr:hypothetical protein [Lentisphaeria bacterium]